MRLQLKSQIALQRFLNVLADEQLPEILQIGKSIQKKNALDELVRMLHLVYRLVLRIIGRTFQSPVRDHAEVKKVLVDGGQLILEDRVQMPNDGWITLHGALVGRSGAHLQRARAGKAIVGTK